MRGFLFILGTYLLLMLLTHEELFLETVADLRNKINVGKKYELIRACGLCRHLIIDPVPLVHIVNRTLKIPLIFHVADFSNHSASKIRMQVGWTTIDPSSSIVPTKEVALDPFLSIKLLNYHNLDFTVKEIIRAASHFYGGIHSLKPEKKQAYLVDLDKAAHSDEKLSLMAIRATCKVVAKAMEPIEAAILGHTHAGGFLLQS